MEGSSGKMSQIYNDGGTSNAETFESRAPPPPYQHQQPPVTQQPQQPQQMGQNIQFVQHPGTSVHVVQQPVTMMQPGMQQVIVGPNMGTHTVVGGMSTVMIHPSIGNMPSMIRCHACQQQIVTSVNYTPSGRTHIWAAVLCLFGCWPLVCLPYCMNSCMRAEHHCPNCRTFVGAY